MEITTPRTSPRLVMPIIEGLKSFVSSVVNFVFGFWDDSVGLWDDSTIGWGTAIESQKRPIIGEINITIPKVR